MKIIVGKFLNPALLILILIVGIACLLKLAQVFIATPLIQSAYLGESFEYLNQLIQAHSNREPEVRNLGYYTESTAGYVNRLIIVFLLTSGFFYLMWFRYRKQLIDFFNRPTHPVNLAVIRIVLFAYLLSLGSLYHEAITLSSENASMVPPPGWGIILNYFPVNETLTSILILIFKTSCIFSLLGLSTRYAVISAAVTGLFVLGIPQFFGKIDHYHHLWLFIFILSFTRSGDALSLDSAIRVYRNPNLKPPGQDSAYTIPIRMMWILIALTYFFPGFWKFVLTGMEWAFSENLKYKMHTKWIELDGWTPSFRIDHYPFIYMSAALGTIIWEIGFLFALFFDRLRTFAVFSGILFHFMTWWFMQIFFKALVVMYVVFVDWAKWFKITGKLLFTDQIVVHYNEKDQFSYATARLAKQYDYFDSIKISSSNSFNAKKHQGGIELEKGENLVHAYPLLLRIPFLLFCLPVIFVGKFVSNWHSDNSGISYLKRKSAIIAGAAVIFFKTLTGVTLIDSWPFGVYPTFASLESPVTATIKIDAVNSEDEVIASVIPLLEQPFRDAFGHTPRLRGFLLEALTTTQPNPDSFIRLVNIWNPDFSDSVAYYMFWHIELNTNPDEELRDYEINQARYRLDLSERVGNLKISD